ncbi:MAG TPA: DUF5916 domain-containing protein [Gemmatimonadales bacterium]|nr:DUF5916 domain-containing protein [Gemmatimonadales bacterium]
MRWLVLAVLVMPPPARSQSDPRIYRGAARQLAIAIPRIPAEIAIDGVLDEPVWNQAALLNGFSQYRPVDSRPAADSTEVLVWYAPDAIYFGIRAFEAHGTVVRATLSDRDNIDGDDRVILLLDTYADRRRALLFAVNPLGVQEDGIWSDGVEAAAGGPTAGGRLDATIDLNPDFVYQSRGRLTSFGYEVEIRIPFKSLRYQSRDPQDWGFQALRETQHTGYEDTWAPAVRATASFLSQSGTLRGLTGMHRGLVMDATPEFTTRVNGAPGVESYEYTGEPNLGATLRWGVTDNLTLNGTVKPDFSQVEADVGQVTTNVRFPLFFPEKRPFFLEGLEQFATPNRLIYTRQIVAPLAGAKLVGKIGATNVAYLGAVDSAPPASGDNPIFNLLRLRRDLDASSTAGLVYTDRIEGGAYNRVFGSDVRAVWRRIWFSQAQLVGSWTRDATGARAGVAWDAILFDRTGRAYGNHGELAGVSPTFEAQAGFVPRTDVVQASLFNRKSWYGHSGGWWEQITTFIGYQPLWKYDEFFAAGSTFEGGLNNTWIVNAKGGWGLALNVSDLHQRFDSAAYTSYAVDPAGRPFATPAGLYNLFGGQATVNTPNRALAVALTAGYAEVPIFAEAAAGREATAQLTLTWHPNHALRAELLWSHDRITRARDGSEFSRAEIPRLKLEYQFSRAIFLRYVGQYDAETIAALIDPHTGGPLYAFDTATGRYLPVAARNTNEFRNDFLFSYKPSPGTVCFLGYGASLDEPEAFGFHQMTRTSDGFFFKVSYLFRT